MPYPRDKPSYLWPYICMVQSSDHCDTINHLMRSRVDTYIHKQNLNDRTSLLYSEKLRVTSQSRVHFAFIGNWRALKFKMQPLKLLVFLILSNILFFQCCLCVDASLT